jgi:hypothetical protein
MNAQTKTKVNGNPEAHAKAADRANAKRAERKARMAQEERDQARADENVKHREQARAERAKAEAEAEAKKNEAGTIKAEDKAELIDLVNQPRTKAEIKGWLLFKGYTAKVAMAILTEYMSKAEKSERAKSLRDHLWAHCSTSIMTDEDFDSLMSTGTPNEVKHRTVFNNERMMFNKIHQSYKNN